MAGTEGLLREGKEVESQKCGLRPGPLVLVDKDVIAVIITNVYCLLGVPG